MSSIDEDAKRVPSKARHLENRNLLSRVEELGLQEDPNSPKLFGEQSYTPFRFKREPIRNVPSLSVSLDFYPDVAGYNLVVVSQPFEKRYHRYTEAPIKEDQVVDQLKQYLHEIDNVQNQK